MLSEKQRAALRGFFDTIEEELLSGRKYCVTDLALNLRGIVAVFLNDDTPTPNRPRTGTLFLLDYGHGINSRIAKEDGYYYVDGEICGSWDSFDAFTTEGSWTWRYPERTYADGRRDAFQETLNRRDELMDEAGIDHVDMWCDEGAWIRKQLKEAE